MSGYGGEEAGWGMARLVKLTTGATLKYIAKYMTREFVSAAGNRMIGRLE